MNQQTLEILHPEHDAFGDGSEQPLPTIEPQMAEMSAEVEDAVPDAPSALTLEPIPEAMVYAPEIAEPALAQEPPEADLAAYMGRPISAVMDRTLWTVHAEDSIEKVEEILGGQNLKSAPVVGSNGAIVGMIGGQELSQFHSEGKNAKAVQAWEIARIRTFEVAPGDSVEEVAKLMAEHKVENISVTECGRLIGIVSTQDLLNDMLKALPESTNLG